MGALVDICEMQQPSSISNLEFITGVRTIIDNLDNVRHVKLDNGLEGTKILLHILCV